MRQTDLSKRDFNHFRRGVPGLVAFFAFLQVVHTDDTALDIRIGRARMLQRTMSHLDATSVEDLEAYRTRRNSLIIHYNSLTKLGGVDHLHATRRRVVCGDDGEIAHLQRAAM